MKPKIAICYDFDGTLSPHYMQEYDFIPKLGMKPSEFWKKATELAKKWEADPILTYMGLMLEEATKHDDVTITKKDFARNGKGITFFPGVEGWFERMDKYGASKGVVIEHYVISSGIKEMIEGTKIAKHFKKIFASSFVYDKHGVAVWPAMAINYTTKTQFLFRINKGVADISDNEKVNEYVSEEQREVPFKRMIFIGDGQTDIPCMRLVKGEGGYAAAVYRPHSAKSLTESKHLISNGRVHLVAAADYRSGSVLDGKIKEAIDKMVADHKLFLTRR